MKTLIIYQTQYKTTQHYAELLANSYQCQCIQSDQVGKYDLNDYDHLIWGMPIYYSKPKGYAKFVELQKNLSSSKTSVFFVGGTQVDAAYSESLRLKYIEPLGKPCSFYYFQGIVDQNALKFKDKVIVSMITKSLASKQNDTLSLLEQSLLELKNNPRTRADCTIDINFD